MDQSPPRSDPEQPSGPDEATWAEFELDVDDDALAERAETVVVDRELRLRTRANRLALVRSAPVRHSAAGTGIDAVDLQLRCVAHAHPGCHFRWVRVTLDASPTPGATISDLSPRSEISDHPVRITTTYHGGLSFNIAHVPLSPEVSSERTTERDVYYPTVTVSGIGLQHAIWDFVALDGSPLYLDRQLRLLLSVPSEAAELPTRLTVRAAIALDGIAGTIPVLGRRTATIQA